MLEIENFPTNEVAKRMLEMVSPIYDDAYVGKWLFQVIGVQTEIAQSAVLGVLNEAFPETATYSLPWWENLYGIEPNEGATTDERRKKILSKRYTRRPLNPARIEAKIAEATGREVVLHENTAPYTYDVEIKNGDTPINMDAVHAIIEETRQSNKRVRLIMNATLNVKIATGFDYPGFKYPFPVAGVKPDWANAGGASGSGLNAEVGLLKTNAVFKKCGAVTLRKGV